MRASDRQEEDEEKEIEHQNQQPSSSPPDTDDYRTRPTGTDSSEEPGGAREGGEARSRVDRGSPRESWFSNQCRRAFSSPDTTLSMY